MLENWLRSILFIHFRPILKSSKIYYRINMLYEIKNYVKIFIKCILIIFFTSFGSLIFVFFLLNLILSMSKFCFISAEFNVIFTVPEGAQISNSFHFLSFLSYSFLYFALISFHFFFSYSNCLSSFY